MSAAATVPPMVVQPARPFASARATVSTRIGAAILAFLAFSVLLTGALLKPDPAGMGTHQQLGLPPCGWLAATGYPCPTCGMTTSFTALAHAQPAASLHAQPFGTLLALATTVFFWGALHVAVFGSQLGRCFERLLTGRYLWPACALFLAAWAWKCWQVRAGM